MRNLSQLLPQGISTKFGRQALTLQKNSPGIMLGVGIAAAVTSTVLACRATLKLEETLDKNNGNIRTAKQLLAEDVDSYTVSDYNRDMAIIKVRTAVDVVKLYGPALGVGFVAIGCLTGSHTILNRRNVALGAAYSAVDKAFNEYRDRVRAQFGDEQDRKFRYGTEEVEVEVRNEDGSITKKRVEMAAKTVGNSMYARLFDEFTREWNPNPEVNRLFIQCQQNWANDLLRARGHVFLNEVYDLLGIERSSAGAMVGWVLNKGGDNYIDFGLNDGDESAYTFMRGNEASVWLDFNVDGVIYDLIED